MTEIRNVFDLGSRALSAQMQRLNTTASNLANASSMSGSAETAFRALRPVFVVDEAAPGSGLAAPRADRIVALDRDPARIFRPDHPNADAEGFVYEARRQCRRRNGRDAGSQPQLPEHPRGNVHLADADDPHPFDGR